MYKAVGLLFAVLASTGFGMVKAAEFTERKRLLEEFRESLLCISTQIGYFKEPLPLIFEKLAGTDNRRSALLLRTCLCSYSDGEKTLGECWKAAVEETYGKGPLTEKDLAVMKLCGDFLGQSDYENQQKHFELLFQSLAGQIDEAEEFIKTKGRMYGKLGLSAGLIFAILWI